MNKKHWFLASSFAILTQSAAGLTPLFLELKFPIWSPALKFIEDHRLLQLKKPVPYLDALNHSFFMLPIQSDSPLYILFNEDAAPNTEEWNINQFLTQMNQSDTIVQALEELFASHSDSHLDAICEIMQLLGAQPHTAQYLNTLSFNINTQILTHALHQTNIIKLLQALLDGSDTGWQNLILNLDAAAQLLHLASQLVDPQVQTVLINSIASHLNSEHLYDYINKQKVVGFLYLIHHTLEFWPINDVDPYDPVFMSSAEIILDYLQTRSTISRFGPVHDMLNLPASFARIFAFRPEIVGIYYQAFGQWDFDPRALYQAMAFFKDAFMGHPAQMNNASHLCLLRFIQFFKNPELMRILTRLAAISLYQPIIFQLYPVFARSAEEVSSWLINPQTPQLAIVGISLLHVTSANIYQIPSTNRRSMAYSVISTMVTQALSEIYSDDTLPDIIHHTTALILDVFPELQTLDTPEALSEHLNSLIQTNEFNLSQVMNYLEIPELGKNEANTQQ